MTYNVSSETLNLTHSLITSGVDGGGVRLEGAEALGPDDFQRAFRYVPGSKCPKSVCGRAAPCTPLGELAVLPQTP